MILTGLVESVTALFLVFMDLVFGQRYSGNTSLESSVFSFPLLKYVPYEKWDFFNLQRV
jgi:hypothetical protein